MAIAPQECNKLSFGTRGLISGLNMAVETITGENNPQYTAEAKDKDGSTKAVVAGKRTGSITVSGYALGGDGGDAVVVNGKFDYVENGTTLKCVIIKVNKTQSNSDFQKIEFTAKFWEDVDNQPCP